MTVPVLGGAKRALFVFSLVLIGLLALPATSSAIVATTWQGDVDVSWDTPGNWDTGAVPTASDDVFINNTSDGNLFPNPTVDSLAQVADSVTLSGSRQLNIVTGGELTVNGTDGLITAPAGTNVNLTGGELTFNRLRVDNSAGFTATGGEFAGILDATTATTITINGASYGTNDSNGVTLDFPVSVTQTADVTMQGSEFLNIDDQLYTLDDVNILEAASAGTTIRILAAGTLFHNGGAANVIQPDIDSSGIIHTDAGAGTLTLASNGGGNTNQLGGTLRTAGNGNLVLTTDGTGDTYTVKAGGLTVNNPSGVVELLGGASFDFALNGQTISLNGDLTWDGAGGGVVSGTGSFDAVSPNFGDFLIDEGNFATSSNVTVTTDIISDTTARVIDGTTWSNVFTFNVLGVLEVDDDLTVSASSTINVTGGTLELEDSDITTSAAPVINVNSTGTLRNIGSSAGLVEPDVDSAGFIEDASTGAGALTFDDTPSVANEYNNTMRTFGSAGEIVLGTGVHAVDGALTMDTSSGTATTSDDGTIRTDAGADLQLGGNTVTLVGTSLDHNDGAISGTGTINGPGVMNLGGGDFAGGGAMTINAPVVQDNPTDFSGFGSELRVGGLWQTSDNITFSGDPATSFMNILSSGELEAQSGTFSVDPPLQVSGQLNKTGTGVWTVGDDSPARPVTINGSGVVDVDSGELNLPNLTNYSGGTLTDGTYSTSGILRVPGDVDTLDAALTVDGTGSLRDITDDLSALSGLDTIASGGFFKVENGHLADVAPTLTVSGELGGDGGRVAADVVNNGVVSPGSSVGTFGINGNYTQGPSGTLEIEVDGTGAGEADLLDVDGDVSLAGELALLPSSSYAASAATGDQVSFLQYTGGRTDEFATTTVTPPLNNGKPFTAVYDDPGQRVFAEVGQGTPTPTPTPSPTPTPTPTLPSLSIGKDRVKEGKKASLLVTLSGASTTPVTVGVTFGGGTAKGKDFKKAAQTLTFAPGTTVQQLSVKTKQDKRDEKNETFFATLVTPSGATLAVAQGKVTIKDNDR